MILSEKSATFRVHALPQSTILFTPVNALIEVAKYAGRDAPDVTILVRDGVILADDALPIAALALMVFGLHQKVERHFEGLADFRPVERQPVAGLDARQCRQDTEAAEGQIKIEVDQGLDAGGRQSDLLLGFTERRPDRTFVLRIDL